jgi:hypothetical protein
LGLGLVALLAPRGDAAIDTTCSATGTPTVVSGASLDTSTPFKYGTVYNRVSGRLEVQKKASNFRSTSLAVTDLVAAACAGDFDNDGWTDFIGAGDDPEFLKFYKNRTYENPEPADWLNPALVRAPKFVDTTTLEAPSAVGNGSNIAMGCGDFNLDGSQDVFYTRCVGTGLATTCYPNRADLYLGNGNGTFQPKYGFINGSETSVLMGSNRPFQRLPWIASTVAVLDLNSDGFPDFLFGAATDTSSRATLESRGGDVLRFLNNGSARQPKFTKVANVLTHAGFNAFGPTAIAVEDFNADGFMDLIAGGVSTNQLRFYPGTAAGISTVPQSPTLTFVGAGTVALAADFSQDFYPDLIMGTDNWGYPCTGGYCTTGHLGGQSFYYENNQTPTPVPRQLHTHEDPHGSGKRFDYDMGFVLDYDHDPNLTPDVIIADGNHAGTYYVLANRVTPEYVECGVVYSDVIDAATVVSDADITVTTVRIKPTFAENGGTISFEVTNDYDANPQQYVPAALCPGSTTDYCATFTSSVGSRIGWMATLCSDATRTRTPVLSGMSTGFEYIQATKFFHTGPIARDGVIYAGAVGQPGDSGFFFGISDETLGIGWEAGGRLDATVPGSRRIYTSNSASSPSLVPFVTPASSALQSILGAPDAASAAAVINWQKSARFGINPRHVLGAIENSTAAVVTPPVRPYWYSALTTPEAERGRIDTYIKKWAARPQVALVGAMDGAVHAFRSNPDNLADANNGAESWAYIPLETAQRLRADCVRSSRASPQVCASTNGGTGVTSYPDGSPTLADVKTSGGSPEWRTLMVSGMGNGGSSVFALDVTDGVAATDGTTTWNIKPLWQFTDVNMGTTHSKPTVMRTKIGTTETFLSIFASGPGGPDASCPTKGHTVYAVDALTGSLVWSFALPGACTYVSTDIVSLDIGAPSLGDGVIDFIFIGDNQGRVWKVNPGAFAAPASPFFTVPLVSGNARDRGIAGTMALGEVDSTVRLFFATGGTRESSAAVVQSVFAIDATTGDRLAVYSQTVGTRFIGGVVFNAGQILASTARDVGGSGLCSTSEGNVIALSASSLAEQFVVPVGTKVTGPLFVSRGEFYTVNATGELVTSPFQGAGRSGGGAGSGMGSGSGSGSGTGVVGSSEAQTPFSMLGWRQVQ